MERKRRRRPVDFGVSNGTPGVGVDRAGGGGRWGLVADIRRWVAWFNREVSHGLTDMATEVDARLQNCAQALA
jgi:hypothetical protein